MAREDWVPGGALGAAARSQTCSEETGLGPGDLGGLFQPG